MRKIITIFLILVLCAVGILFFLSQKTDSLKKNTENLTIISPFAKVNQEDKQQEAYKKNYPLGNPINIMLLGIDRRSRAEGTFRTDIMILLSVNLETKKVLLMSLPRDLWYEGNKINAVYILGGWEEYKKAIKQVTNLEVDRFILTDFVDFSWIVDSLGGINVNVDNSFTDVEYPVDETKEYQTINFVQGETQLDGKNALIFARSRHGDNGEGSDWARMKRQHKILKGMLSSVLQPKSLFNPMVVEKAFDMLTNNRMDTNLQLNDAKYLWEFYKDKDQYEITSMYLDNTYLYTPPMEDYGGAWTLVPIGDSYEKIQQDIKLKLDGSNDVVEEIQQDNPENASL